MWAINGLSAKSIDLSWYVPRPGDRILDHYPPDPGEVPSWDAAQAAMVVTQTNANIQAQMDRLDGGGQARQVRESLLAANLPSSDGLTRLQALETQITALRATLKQEP